MPPRPRPPYRRRPSRGADHYVGLGIQAIAELLEEECAVVWPEVEARIGEQKWRDLPYPIDPHHLTTARRALEESDFIRHDTQRTRGGRLITVLVPADSYDRARKIEDAAARKRLLHGRYQTWALGSKSQKALLGPAGETLLHNNLVAAAPHGFRLVHPDGGEVRSLLGSSVTGGPLDSAALMTVLKPEGTVENYWLLIEVKNVRSTLYPQAAEVHQVLYKAAAFQNAHPELNVTPVLVARRLHFTAFAMAKQLGAFFISLGRQPITLTAALNLDHLEEVRQELAYLDMTTDTGVLPWLVDRFTSKLQGAAPDFSPKWRQAAPHIEPFSKILRGGSMNQKDRSRLVDDLRIAVEANLGDKPGW